MIFVPSIGLPVVAEAQPPIRIGASLSQTGAFASLRTSSAANQLCLKHTNEKGGVLGQSATAIRIYERLITQEHVDLVLGPYGSPNVEAVASATEKYSMPTVSPSGDTTSIFKKGRNRDGITDAGAAGRGHRR